MTDHTTDRVLHALYCLSRYTCHIDATELARAVAITPTEAAQALLALEQAGWVDASRARLTMLGLARAAALNAGSNGGPRIDLRHARPRSHHTVAPLAAAAARDVRDDSERYLSALS